MIRGNRLDVPQKGSGDLIWVHACNFRRRVVRVWPKQPVGLPPKVAKIIPGSPIALERMPPRDGLLTGIVCLSPALVGSLRDAAVFAHVAGNMENEGLHI